MCTLCIEVQKQTMTKREVARAYREFNIPSGHVFEVMSQIQENYGLEDVAAELNELYLAELTKGVL